MNGSGTRWTVLVFGFVVFFHLSCPLLGTSQEQSGSLTYPLRDSGIRLTQGWYYTGTNEGDFPHEAIDVVAPTGTNVLATAEGLAIASCQPPLDISGDRNRNGKQYGRFIFVHHSDGYSTLYAHLDSVLLPADSQLPCDDMSRHSIQSSSADIHYLGGVFKWKRVKRGEMIGKVGNTGTITPHLHFEVAVNPEGSYAVHVTNRVDPYAIEGVAFLYPPPEENCSNVRRPSDYLWTSCPPVPPEPSLTIRTDTCEEGTSCSGPQGTTFNFEGSAFTPDGTVRRFIEDSTGHRSELTPLLDADAIGQITWSFNSSCASPVGAFFISAVDSVTNRTSNHVTEIITPGNCASLAPDLAVNLSDNPDPVRSGERITYAVWIQNVGNSAAAGVRIVQTLPFGTSLQSCSRFCTVVGNSVVLDLGTMPAGTATNLLINVLAPLVSSRTNITATAAVSTTTPETTTANNEASQTTTVDPNLIEVFVSPSTVTLAPGDMRTFTATVIGTTNTAVSWSVQEGAVGGTITSDGAYTAPDIPGIYHVVATSQADPTKSGTAIVTVVDGNNLLLSFIPSPSGNGRAIAFDPETGKIYYTLSGPPEIYVTDIRNSLATILFPGINFGALSWDAKRGVLWAGAYTFDRVGNIYQVFPTGIALFQFNFIPSGGNCYGISPGFIDGLAYDEGPSPSDTDDTLWISDDAGLQIHRIDLKGNLIATYRLPNNPRSSNRGCNTGIAVDGDFLWLALQSGPDQQPHDIVLVTKANPSRVVASFPFSDTNFPGPEGLAVDLTSIPGKAALWSNQFGVPNSLKLWDITELRKK